MRRWVGWFVATLFACASCSGSTASPKASGSQSTGSSNTASAPQGSAPATGHDVAGSSGDVTADDAFAELVGVSTKNADPALAAAAEQVRQQLGDQLSGPMELPATPTYGGLRRRSGLDDLLILSMLIEANALPSRQGAEALATMAHRVAHSGGLDAPDGPESAEKDNDKSFDVSDSTGALTGTLAEKVKVEAEHAHVKVDLTQDLAGTSTRKSVPGAFGANVHSIESTDVCPDAAGVVPADIQSDVQITAGTTVVKFQIVGHFLGYVNDNADLTNITGTANVTGLTVTDGNSQDPYTFDFTQMNFPVKDGVVQFVDVGKWDSNSSTDLGGKAAAVAWNFTESLKALFTELQQLWQDNSCVTIQIPDFDTYAPTLPNKDVDFVKTLDAGAKVEFTVQVHHRFEHTNINVAVTQTLDKEVKLDPAKLSTTPGKSTYEAPNKVGEGNIGTFESRSRRGKSVLKGRFFTEEKPPTIGITGTITSAASLATETGPITMGPIQFTGQSAREDGGTDYSIDAPVSGNYTLSMSGIALPCATFATEQGTIHLTAHSEARGDNERVWVIEPDPGRSHFDTTVTCKISVSRQFSQGSGMIAKFFAALGTMEIPIDPATTSFDKSRPLPLGSSDHSVAQVTLVPPPP